MRILLGLFVAFLLFGCLGPSPEGGNVTAQQPVQPSAPSAPTTNVTEPVVTEPTPPDTGNGQPEVPEPVTTSVAKSQADCSTLAPDCESCLAKKGCRWCKGTNACYYEGIVPTISSCEPSEWATTVSECKIVADDEYCSDITNCADCLSGTGCKWCIQGSMCVGESSTDECFGGWMTESYQCNYASR